MEPILALMLAVACYTLGWLHRHRQVDAQRAEAERLALYIAERATAEVRTKDYMDGYHMRARVDLLTGRSGPTPHLEDVVRSVPEYMDRLRNIGGI